MGMPALWQPFIKERLMLTRRDSQCALLGFYFGVAFVFVLVLALK